MNHHYVPQFYLARWEDPSDRRIHYYYYVNSRLICGKKTKKYLACEERLYSLNNVEEMDVDLLENKHYSRVDNDASIIITKLINQGVSSLNDKDKKLWCDFIISMMIRNPTQVNRAVEYSKPILSRFLTPSTGGLFESNIANHTIAAMSGYLEYGEQEFTNRFRKTLPNLNWWIEDFSSTNLSLLINDRPVLIYPVSTRYDGDFNGKITELLTNFDFILSLPIYSGPQK